MRFLAALLLAGCGAQMRPPPGPSDVVLGTSALDGSGFTELVGDQTLVAGSQGGFHIWIKFRVTGMAPGRVVVHRTARRVSDDRLILRADGTQDIGEPSADGFWETPNAIPSFMCPTPIGVNVIGEPIAFDLQILDEHGSVLGETKAQATPLCPTGDQGSFCMRICSG
jgi:hypothetical protein